MVGTATTVVGDVYATCPTCDKPQKLTRARTVNHLDKIVTGPNGRLQVTLRDDTVFTVGPNSEFYLDEFVYDPSPGTGKIVARVTKGVFRFVTGKVAQKNPENMQIKVPGGDLGFRGTDVEVEVDTTPGRFGASSATTRVKVNSGEAQFTPTHGETPIIVREGVKVAFNVSDQTFIIFVWEGEVEFSPKSGTGRFVIRTNESMAFEHSGKIIFDNRKGSTSP